MILKLRDKTEITLSQEEAEAVGKMIEAGTEFIKIGTVMVRRSEIASIQPGGITGDAIPDFNKKALPENKCNGQKSIQREISKRLVKKYPTTWAEKVRNKKVRETIRKEIINEDKNAEWCDHVAGTCACVKELALA